MPPSDLHWTALPAGALAVALLVRSIATADWHRLAGEGDAHRFFGLATAVAALWHADPAGAAGLHLLGASAACALLGLRLALVALAAGTGLQHVADGVDVAAWPVAFLAGAALPAAIAHLGFGWALRGRERLGPLPWVAAAFVTGAVSMLASVIVRGGLGAAAGAPGPVGAGPSGAPAVWIAMAIAEAQLTAAVVATVAAQRPEWLSPPRTAGRRP